MPGLPLRWWRHIRVGVPLVSKERPWRHGVLTPQWCDLDWTLPPSTVTGRVTLLWRDVWRMRGMVGWRLRPYYWGSWIPDWEDYTLFSSLLCVEDSVEWFCLDIWWVPVGCDQNASGQPQMFPRSRGERGGGVFLLPLLVLALVTFLQHKEFCTQGMVCDHQNQSQPRSLGFMTPVSARTFRPRRPSAPGPGKRTPKTEFDVQVVPGPPAWESLVKSAYSQVSFLIYWVRTPGGGPRNPHVKMSCRVADVRLRVWELEHCTLSVSWQRAPTRSKLHKNPGRELMGHISLHLAEAVAKPVWLEHWMVAQAECVIESEDRWWSLSDPQGFHPCLVPGGWIWEFLGEHRVSTVSIPNSGMDPWTLTELLDI